MAIAIPLNKGTSEAKIAIDTLMNMELLSKNSEESLKQQKELIKIQEKGDTRDQQLLKLANEGFITQKQAKFLRLKNKATVYFDKFLVKNKWLQKISKTLGGILANAGSWIWDLLKLIFFLAIFDPNGKFLASILGFITKMVIMFVNILAKYVPKIIRTMIKLITEVIPPLLIKMINAIFPAIAKMLRAWGKDLSKNFPFLGWVVQQFAKLFDKDGILTNFARMLAKLFPIIIGGFIILKAYAKLKGPLSIVFGLFKGFGKMLLWIGMKLFPTFMLKMGLAFSSLLASVKSFLIAIGPIALIIGGIVAISAALISAWKNSKKHHENFQRRIKGMSKDEEVIYRNTMRMSVESLGNAMEVFKKKGIGAGFKELFKDVFMAFSSIKKDMIDPLIVWFQKNVKKAKKWLGAFIGGFKNVLNKIGSFFSRIFRPIIDILGPVFDKIGKALSFVGKIVKWLWDTVVEKISAAFETIKNTLRGLFSWFEGIGTFGFAKWLWMSGGEKEKYLSASKELSERGLELSKIRKLSEIEDETKRQKEYSKLSSREQQLLARLGLVAKTKEGKTTLVDYKKFEDIMEKIAKGKVNTVKVYKGFNKSRQRKGK